VPEPCAGVYTAELIASIRSTQNPDGGWGYAGRSSWTEPTAFALLALASAGSLSESFQAGIRWLAKAQRGDGGWAPNASVSESTWVTAPAVLALAESDSGSNLQPAVDWLLRQTGEESSLADRLRRILMGSRMESGEGTSGWPWLAGTAGWVMPTSLTILALEKAERHRRATGTRDRVRQGREFLLARICRDGGWNYGSPEALGYQANSYPDTTGMALLALHGSASAKLTAAIMKAESQLPQCHSPQTSCWLRIGLAAHGRRLPEPGDCRVENAPLLDHSLILLARAAEENRLSVWGAV
jgi:hypothetical protein